jgi:hypothetical protein
MSGHDHHETPVEAPIEIPVLAPNPMFLRKKSTIVSVPTVDDFGTLSCTIFFLLLRLLLLLLLLRLLLLLFQALIK